jgi:hypothetical protein
VDAGLFTQQQLVQLGATKDVIEQGPCAGQDPNTNFTVCPGAAGNGWLKTFDVKLSAPIKIRERFTISPGISVFNVFNFANFAIAPGTRADTTLNAGSGFGVPYGFQANRAGLGSGVFTLGAARQLEYSLRIAF